MKKLAIAIALISVVGYAGIASAQQSSATASAVPATADVVAAITINKTANLNFGQVIKGAGTVVMPPTGSRIATGDTTLANATGANAAAFHVTGNLSDTYAITLPDSITITHTNATDTMSVGTFTKSAGAGTLSEGVQDFTVGATLTVLATQVSGSYSGTFNVMVAYN